MIWEFIVAVVVAFVGGDARGSFLFADNLNCFLEVDI